MSAEALSVFHVEAAIASLHAAAPAFADTDWRQLAHYYDILEELKPTPVVRLNAAISFAYADSPEAGLDRLDRLAAAPPL